MREEPPITFRREALPIILSSEIGGWCEKGVEPLKQAHVDVLVLGCTHYPLMKTLLARVMGPGVTLVDSAEETAKAVASELESRGLLTDGGSHDHLFVVSDDEPHFRRVGARFLGEQIKQVEVVPL